MVKTTQILHSPSFTSLNSSRPATNSPTGIASLSPSPLFPRSRDENYSATTIQKIVRGHLDRKAFMPSSSYSQYVKLCGETQTTFMKMADQGKIDVYFPEGSSVVLKHLFPRRENQTARDNAIQRFQSTHPVRAILREIKASHLVIPKSYLCKDFLVEERLPIVSKSYECSQLYRKNLSKFEQPVREMVGLLSKINIPFLVHYKFNHDRTEVEVTDIRYDNIPFLVVDKKNATVIKIGLIDLQRAGEKSKVNISHRLNELSMIFPFHTLIIIDEANRLGLPYNSKLLEKASKSGYSYLLSIPKPEEDAPSGRSFLPKRPYVWDNSKSS